MSKRKSKANSGSHASKHSSSSDDGMSHVTSMEKVSPSLKARPTSLHDNARNDGYSISQLAMLGIVITLIVAVFGPTLSLVLKNAIYSPEIVTIPEPIVEEPIVEKSVVEESITDDAVWLDSSNGVGKAIGSDYVCKHDYNVKIVRVDPLILMIENFLQPGEANHMMNISANHMTRSGLQFGDGIRYEDRTRTSTTAWVQYHQDAVTRCIHERVKQFTNIPEEDFELLQVIRYQPGQHYSPHYDFMRDDDMLMYDDWSRSKGQRWATMIVYLNTPEAGGSTSFPRLKLSFKPVKNSAIFWLNLDRNGLEDWRTEHSGDPVEGGEKWAMNIWPHKMTRPVYERIVRLTAERNARNQQAPVH